jgi:hypothetical protein
MQISAMHLRGNLVSPDSDDQNGRIPAGIQPFCAGLILTILVGFQPERLPSGHFHRNSANLDFNETVRISATVIGILPVNDGISSPMIFILFYINNNIL